MSAAQLRVREALKARSGVVVECLAAAEAALVANQTAEAKQAMLEKSERCAK